jgi:hypothetical protein
MVNTSNIPITYKWTLLTAKLPGNGQPEPLKVAAHVLFHGCVSFPSWRLITQNQCQYWHSPKIKMLHTELALYFCYSSQSHCQTDSDSDSKTSLQVLPSKFLQV